MKAKKLVALLLACLMLVGSALTAIAADGDVVALPEGATALKLTDEISKLNPDVTGKLVEDSTSPTGYAAISGFMAPGTGDDDAVDAAIDSGNYTFEAWVNPNVVGQGYNGFIMKDDFEVGLMDTKDGLQFCLNDWNVGGNNGWMPIYDSENHMIAGEWNHIVATAQWTSPDLTLKLYVNGAEVATGTWNNVTALSHRERRVGFGAADPDSNYGGRELKAGSKIAAGGIYKDVLTAGEVLAHYTAKSGAAPEDENCVLWYDTSKTKAVYPEGPTATQTEVSYTHNEALYAGQACFNYEPWMGWIGNGNTFTYEFFSEEGGLYWAKFANYDLSKVYVSVNGSAMAKVDATELGDYFKLTLVVGKNTITFGNPSAYLPDLKVPFTIYKNDEADAKYFDCVKFNASDAIKVGDPELAADHVGWVGTGSVNDGGRNGNNYVYFEYDAAEAGEYEVRVYAAGNNPGYLGVNNEDNFTTATSIDLGGKKGAGQITSFVKTVRLEKGYNTLSYGNPTAMDTEDNTDASWAGNLYEIQVEKKSDADKKYDKHIAIKTEAAYADSTITWGTTVAPAMGLSVDQLNEQAVFTGYGAVYGVDAAAVEACIAANHADVSSEDGSYKIAKAYAFEDLKTDEDGGVVIYDNFSFRLTDVPNGVSRAAAIYVTYTVDNTEYTVYSNISAIETAE